LWFEIRPDGLSMTIVEAKTGQQQGNKGILVKQEQFDEQFFEQRGRWTGGTVGDRIGYASISANWSK